MKPRNLSLDVLRAVAVLLVLGRHLPLGPHMDHPYPEWLFGAWARGGWVGVDLFFVLSGFLVSGLLFSEYQTYQSLRVVRFFLRRGLKIYPAFYTMMLFCLWQCWALEVHPTGWMMVSELCFLQSYIQGIFNHTWSLAVEEHFYLLLPLLLTLLIGISRPRSPDPFRAVPALTAALAALALAARTYNAVANPFSQLTHLFATHLRLDSLMFGVLLSYLYHFHPHRFRQVLGDRVPLLWLMGLAFCAPVFFCETESPWIYGPGFTLIYLGCGSILASVLMAPLPPNPVNRLLAFLGEYSYTIYLWHMVVLVWWLPLLEARLPLPWSFALSAPLYLALSLVTGIVTAKLVERPVLSLRERVLPSRSRAL